MQSTLAGRFREVTLDGDWVAGTNLKEVLRDINLETAKRQIGNLNTIAGLIFHLDYYIAGVLHVFEGGKLEIRDRFSFDLPELKTEKDWEAMKANLFLNASEFARHIEAMTPQQLEQDFVDPAYGTFRRNIEGMIEHVYYHLGQIVLIKKLAGPGTKKLNFK